MNYVGRQRQVQTAKATELKNW